MAELLTNQEPAGAVGETQHKGVVFEDVSIEFEGNQVLDGVSFEVARGET